MRLVNFLDFAKYEARNMLLHVLASAPGSPAEAQVYYNSTDKHPYYHNGTTFKDFTDALTLGGQNSAFHLARANHTGTQTASTISDFDTQVRTSRLDQMAVPTAAVSFNSQRLTNLGDPVSDQDGVTKVWVMGQIAGARDPKDNVRLVTAAALPAYTRVGNVITADANGALPNIDGIAPAANDRVLLKSGAAGADNGIYTVTALGDAGNPFVLTRATDADSSAEVTQGLFVWSTEGTANGQLGWLLITADPITLNTTSLSFTQVAGMTQITAGAGLTKTGNTINVVTADSGRIVVNTDNIDLAITGVGAGTYTSVTVDVYGRVTAGSNPTGVNKYTATIGDGAATSFNITQGTHGCATSRANMVEVIDESTGEVVLADVSIAANGTVTVAVGVAPANNAFRVLIMG